MLPLVIVLIITIETKLVTVPKVRTNDQHHQKYKVTLEGSHQERSIFSPSRTPLAGTRKLEVPGVSEEKKCLPLDVVDTRVVCVPQHCPGLIYQLQALCLAPHSPPYRLSPLVP